MPYQTQSAVKCVRKYAKTREELSCIHLQEGTCLRYRFGFVSFKSNLSWFLLMIALIETESLASTRYKHIKINSPWQQLRKQGARWGERGDREETHRVLFSAYSLGLPWPWGLSGVANHGLSPQWVSVIFLVSSLRWWGGGYILKLE
jgi:hypothetical protein